jgi:NAD-dependent SIR2 family protein deacetylase
VIAGYPGRVRSRPTLQWAPGPDVLALEPGTTDLAPVAEVVAGGGVVVLSGAGISTESGIPDYRGESGSLRTHTPMTYGDFVASESGRRRYWARSHLGWRTIARAAPNDGHRAVAMLQARGYLSGVITQNVDGLHQAAGARDVIELHGNLDRVVCLNCRTTSAREALDRRLRLANAEFEGEATRINPDGDVELPDEVVQTFHVVPCEACTTGVLKPDVVFFGENVPKSRVERCYRLIDESEAVLVLGSSLTVMSGFRFVRHAAKAGKPVLIINQGVTRGDPYAVHRVNLPLGQALADLTAQLG